MTKLYILANQHDDNQQWSEGVEYTVSNDIGALALSGLCAYEDATVAVMLRPVHMMFEQPALWEADGDIDYRDCGLKVFCSRLRTLRQIPLPTITIAQRVRFALRCAQRVYGDFLWTAWAEGWLSGRDRSNASAKIAENDIADVVEIVGTPAVRAAWIATRAARAASEGTERSASVKVIAAATAAVRAAERSAAAELPLAEFAQQALEEEP